MGERDWQSGQDLLEEGPLSREAQMGMWWAEDAGGYANT